MEQPNNNPELTQVQKFLIINFCYNAVLAAALAGAFELDILPAGTWAGNDASLEFGLTTVLELLTVCLIPLMLRLFKFAGVRRHLTTPAGLQTYAIVRMEVLFLLLFANTVLYYLFMNVAFGYMALILVLTLCFVIPTKTRCAAELDNNGIG